MQTSKLLLTVALAGISFSGFAAPAAYVSKKCMKKPLKIVNTTTSSLQRDHEDCNKVWVLPPNAGVSKLSSVTPSSNLGFCGEMRLLQKTSFRIVKRISTFESEADALSPQVISAQQKLEKANEALAAVEKSDAIRELTVLRDQKMEIDAQIENVLTQLDSCNNSCITLNEEYSELSSQRRDLNSQITKLRRVNRDEVRKFKRAESKVTAAEQNFNYYNDMIIAKAEKMTKLRTLIAQMYSQYGKMEGGYAHINYDTGWDQNIETLEKKYPELNFEKVVTRNTRINANFVGSSDKDSYLESLPSILDYSLAGFEFSPYGEEDPKTLASLPSVLSGSIRLSVVGACPVYYSNFLKDVSETLEKRSDLSQGYGFGITATYMYPSVFNFYLEASYNLFKFYEKIVESGSKGGFFSSKSWRKVTETKFDNDTFKIKWLDEANLYSSNEKTKIRKMVKAELMQRALAHMAQPAGRPDPNMRVRAFSNPQPGALILATGLNKTCGWNIYCKAGSWILKGITGIFGSSKATASFKSTHNSKATEIWDEQNILWRPGTTSIVEKL